MNLSVYFRIYGVSRVFTELVTRKITANMAKC